VNPASPNQHPSARSLPPHHVLTQGCKDSGHGRLKANTGIFFAQHRGNRGTHFLRMLEMLKAYMGSRFD